MSWTQPDKSSSNGIVQAIASLITQGSNALTSALDFRYATQEDLANVGGGGGGSGVVPRDSSYAFTAGSTIVNVAQHVIPDNVDSTTFTVHFMQPPTGAYTVDVQWNDTDGSTLAATVNADGSSAPVTLGDYTVAGALSFTGDVDIVISTTGLFLPGTVITVTATA